MLGIEKDLHGTKHYKSFTGNNLGKKQKKQKSKKAARIGKKTVKKLNDQESAFHLTKTVKMH